MSTHALPIPQPVGVSRRLVLVGIVLIELLVLCIPGRSAGMFGAALGGVLAVGGVLLCILTGRVGPLLLGWVLTFPLGYYYLSFPRDSPVISFDRLMIPAIVLAGIFAQSKSKQRLPVAMSRAGVAWSFFLLAAFISLVHMSNILGGAKLWWDAFVLPPILGFGVIRGLNVRKFLPNLHLVACLFPIYCVAIGIAEFVLNTDLMAVPGGIFYAVGETSALVPRVNGPFPTNNSFALIGLVTFFFLLFLRHELPERLPLWRTALHWVGLAATFLMAVMPLYRSVALTMVAALLVDTFLTQRTSGRILRIAALLTIVSAVLAFQLLLPDVFEERSDPGNFYARVAQQKQTWDIFVTHPLTGVGLGNFMIFASQFGGGESNVEGWEAVDAAHNTLGEVLAETGILGVIPFVTAQLLLVGAFWKLRESRTPTSLRVWMFFFYFFITYWISGVSLSSGYCSDLNLWFVFATAVLYKLAISENTELQGATLRPCP